MFLSDFNLFEIACRGYLAALKEIVLKQSERWWDRYVASRVTNWSFQTGFVAAAVLCCVVFVLCYASAKENRPSQESLQAISSVLTPTTCAWPNDYMNFLKHASCKRSKNLNISFSLLLRSLCVGSVELRNNGDIPDILRGQFRSYGWTVFITPDNWLWLRVILWTVFSQVPSLWVWLAPPELFAQHILSHSVQRCEYMRTATSSCLQGHHQGTNSSKKHLDHPTKRSYFTQHCLQTSTLTCLLRVGGCYKDGTVSIDEIPYPYLRSSIRSILQILPRGAALSFQFTTLAPDIAYLSKTFIVCAIPFLPRMFPGVPSHDRVRTSTPLLVPLHQIVGYLSSASSAVNIESMVNISKAYAETLYRGIKDLTAASDCRQVYIDKYGHEAWREQQFLLAWEAGLLLAGHLTRWHVVVRNA